MLHQVQLWRFRPFTPASLCLMSCRLRPRRDDSENQRLCTANTSVTGKVPNLKSFNSKTFNESEHLVALKCVHSVCTVKHGGTSYLYLSETPTSPCCTGACTGSSFFMSHVIERPPCS